MNMKKAIVGKKIGMTQVFAEDGRLVPVTVIEAGPCTVVQTKNKESDGYEAVQVGFGDLTENRAKKLLTKPELGHFKKAGVDAKRTLREFRFDDCSGYKVGDVLKCDQFAQGDKIDITGTSKGHGYTGAIQRWNQHTGSEPGSRSGGRGTQPAAGEGRCARTQRRPADHPRHLQGLMPSKEEDEICLRLLCIIWKERPSERWN